jgi:ribosomal protein S18 acetylase RimI-like enzyme
MVAQNYGGIYMKIRLLTKEDAEIYLAIRLEGIKDNPEVFSTTLDDIMEKDDPIEYKANFLDKESDYTIGAFTDEGDLVGVATLKTSEKEKSVHKGKIVAVYVSPKSRGLGAGRKLIEEIIHLSKELGLEQIMLDVVSGNEPAKKLYEKIGFEKFAKTPNDLKYNDQYWDQDHMIMYLKK